MKKKAVPQRRKGRCPRAYTHRPNVFCSTCGKTAKVRGE